MSGCKTGDKGLQDSKNGGSECFELPVLFGLLKKKGVELSAVDLKNAEKVNLFIRKGELYPLMEFHNPEDVTKEPNLFESGSLSAFTNKGDKKLKVETYLTLCGHKSLLAARDAGFEEFIEVTKDNKFAVVVIPGDESGFVKGQDIGKLLVSQRKRSVDDKVPMTEITVSYKDYTEFEKNGVYIDAGYSPFIDLDKVGVFRGVYDTVGGFLTEDISCGGYPKPTELKVYDAATKNIIADGSVEFVGLNGFKRLYDVDKGSATGKIFVASIEHTRPNEQYTFIDKDDNLFMSNVFRLH